MVDEWYDWIFTIIDASVPVRSNHRAQLSPWVTGRSSNVLKKLSTAEKHKKSYYKILSLRNEAALYLDEDRVEYETKLFSGRNTGSIFEYIKSLKKDSQLPSVIRWNEVSADSNLRKANLFNDYFISVFTRNTLDVQLGESDSQLPDERDASDYQINRDEVYSVLSNLDISRSRGEDQLPPVILRKLAIELTPSVFNVFRNIHRLDTFPEKMGTGYCQSYFQERDKSRDCELSPCTLLNIGSKCFEKIVFSHIADHFIKYVNSAQFGFLPRKSAIHQLFHCLNYIYASISEKDIASCLVMFDFSKAFDKLSHTVLLQNVRNIGIEGKLFKVLRRYLTNISESSHQWYFVGCSLNAEWCSPGLTVGSDFFFDFHRRPP